VVSEKTDVVSVFPMWYRNFSATCLSDTTSEIISNRVGGMGEIDNVNLLNISITKIKNYHTKKLIENSQKKLLFLNPQIITYLEYSLACNLQV
jgi:hypothetical protein